VAETRVANRAPPQYLRYRARSVEGNRESLSNRLRSSWESKKLPPQPVNGRTETGWRAQSPRTFCQLIRQHQLDANPVKSWRRGSSAVPKLSREASREQVEGFVALFTDWALRDRNALLCQLNSYPRTKERRCYEATSESLRPADVSHSLGSRWGLLSAKWAQYRWHKQKPLLRDL